MKPPRQNQETLQAEVEYFEQHRIELLERAPGKYALIKGSALLGIYDTELEAIGSGYRKLGNEAFLVKQIVEADVPLNFASFNLGL